MTKENEKLDRSNVETTIDATPFPPKVYTYVSRIHNTYWVPSAHKFYFLRNPLVNCSNKYLFQSMITTRVSVELFPRQILVIVRLHAH